tara:strand:+ start:95 stop:1285 length:1191 start_codon:yes stop_codon:yes gene_type:complete
MNFSFKKISAKQLQKKQIIIFDETNSNLIERIIPENYNFSVYKTRPVEFIINFSIFLKFISYLGDLKPFITFTPKKNFISNIFWQLLCIYIKSYLLTIKPAAVITSIDNCTKFAWLSKNISSIPFIAIQNGFRLSSDVNKDSLYNCQHLFCFGKFEVDNFPKRGWTINNFYPVGSLNASLNFKNKSIGDKSKYDILIVSCWRGNIGYQQDVQDSMEAMKLFDIDVSNYLKERSLKAGIILRSERDSAHWFMKEVGMTEEEYYQSIYKDRVDIIDTDFSTRNIYQVMMDSEVILAGFCSTALIEAFGIGKKILYCDYTKSNYFNDFDKAITLVQDDFISLETPLFDQLDNLINVSNHQYQECYNDLMQRYQSFNKKHSTQKLIKTKIKEIITLNKAG